METTGQVAAVITATHKITTHITPTNTRSTVAAVADADAITPAVVITPVVAVADAITLVVVIVAVVTAITDLYINRGSNYLLPLLFA